MNNKIEEAGRLLTMPLIPMRGMTILPDIVIHFDLNREKSIQALEMAMMKGGKLFLVTQKDGSEDDPGEDDLCPMGTISTVKQITKLPNQIIRVLAEGNSRGILKGINAENTRFLEAYLELAPEPDEGMDEVEKEAMVRQILEYFTEFSSHYARGDKNSTQRYAHKGRREPDGSDCNESANASSSEAADFGGSGAERTIPDSVRISA